VWVTDVALQTLLKIMVMRNRSGYFLKTRKVHKNSGIN